MIDVSPYRIRGGISSTIKLKRTTTRIRDSKTFQKRTKTVSVPSSSPKNHLSISQKLIAGGISRAASQCILYPIDALRTLTQTRDGRTLADVGASALVRGGFQTSGFALFLGAIQFGLFGIIRPRCGPIIASAVGAAGSCLISVPQEVIKQRLVTGIYSGFRNACGTIYQTEGLFGFYSGWKPTMARNVPFVVATFTANDGVKQWILRNKRQQQNDASSNELTICENILTGMSSALFAAIVTHPADVVKTRMMTQAASTQIPYTSTLNCIVTMFQSEGGLAPFYSGFVQRSLYIVPLWTLQFAMNGVICKYWEKQKRS